MPHDVETMSCVCWGITTFYVTPIIGEHFILDLWDQLHMALKHYSILHQKFGSLFQPIWKVCNLLLLLKVLWRNGRRAIVHVVYAGRISFRLASCRKYIVWGIPVLILFSFSFFYYGNLKKQVLYVFPAKVDLTRMFSIKLLQYCY